MNNRTPEDIIRWISELIDEDSVEKFYKTTEWKHIRRKILNDQNNECQICKRNGRYTPADTVHHMKTVRDHPELALTESNLIAICNECHYQIHHKNAKKWNDEQW